MRKTNARKLLSVVIVLLLVLQLMPFGAALAASGGSASATNLNGTEYLTTSVDNITITSGTTPILPVDGVYENVPENATLEMDVNFALSDGPEGGPIFSYDGSESFTIPLPAGLTFSDTSGIIKVTHTGVGGPYIYDLATYSISGSTLTISLTNAGEDTTGHGGAANANHLGKNATVHIQGTFKKLNAGDPEETSFKIGEQEITIKRVPLPKDCKLEKKDLSYDPATNEITWEVKILPPESAPNQAFDGLTVSDILSGSHAYVAGSFTLNQESIVPTIDGTSMSYTFPDTDPDTTGVQTLTYKTTPTAFNGTANAASVFGNTVSLKSGETKVALDVSDDISLKWISKSGASAATTADPTITQWTVTVTVPGTAGQAVTGAQIIDTLPTNFEFFTDETHPVVVEVTPVDPGTADEKGKYFSDAANGKLIYTFPDESQPVAGTSVVMTFYTKVKANKWDDFLNSNGAISVTNKAEFDWTLNPSTTNPSATGSIGIIGAGGLLSKDLGPTEPANNERYIYSAHEYVQWSITVNRNKVNLGSSAVLSDAVPTGMDFILDADHSLVLMEIGGSFSETYTTAGSGLTKNGTTGFSLDLLAATGRDAISTSFTVTFWTEINSTGVAEFYANGDNAAKDNGTVSFKNDATLTYGNNQKATDDATKIYSTQILKKTAAIGYNYNDKTVKWQIVVNRNKLPLINAKVTDTLPAGMTLLVDTEHPFTIVSTGTDTITPTALTGATGFEISLTDPTSEQYTITFWTKLSEAVLTSDIPWAETGKDFENKSELTATGITKVESNAKVTVINPIIKKSGSYSLGSDIIDWTAVINNTGITLANGKVEDLLSSDIELEPDTVKLYTVSIGSDGLPTGTRTEVTKADTADATHFSFSLTDGTGGRKLLTVYLPTGTNKAYILTFRTHVLNENISVPNTITLLDGEFSQGNTITAIQVNKITSIGGSYSNSLTVHKTDGAQNALEGAVFQLLNKDKAAVTRSGSIITATTNDQGNAVFTSLPSWVFYVREITPPPGYLIVARDSFGEKLTDTPTVNVTNTLGLAAVQITKVGTGSVPLQGVAFELTGTDYTDQPITARTVYSDSNGIVKFENILIGTYQLTEIAAAGHVPNTTPINVTVGYNSDMTGLVVKYNGSTTSPTVSNDPYPATLTFTKTAIGGTPLSGGSFSLYQGGTQKGNSVPANSDGTVTFTNVPIGNYTVREDTPPTGYLRTTGDILSVMVAYNTNRDGLVVTYNGSPTSPTVTNAFAKANVEIDKVGTGVSLNGGQFTLTSTSTYNNQTFTIADVPADSNGKVTFSDVPIGTYTITETEAPAGHQLNNAPIYVTVGYNANKTAVAVKYGIAEGSINQNSASLVNTPIPATVSFTKTDLGGTSISGGSFSLYQGTTKIASSVAAGSDGKVTFTGVAIGSYTIKEDTPPTGYLRPANETILNVTVAYNANRDGLVVTITKGSDTVTSFANAFAKADVQINKLGEGVPLKDGKFTLTGISAYNNQTFTIADVPADSNGKVTFSDVPVGTYTITEVEAPEGHQLPDPAPTVNVVVGYNADETGVEVSYSPTDKTITNTPIPATVSFTKTDLEGAPISGGSFSLYRGQVLVASGITADANGKVTFSGIPIGSYTIYEDDSPNGYLMPGAMALYSVPLAPVSTRILNVTVAYNEANTGLVVTITDPMVEGGQTPVNAYANEPALGELSFRKTDKYDPNKLLTGGLFKLTGKDYADRTVEITASAENGMVTFRNIPLVKEGTEYTVTEVTPPSGYRLTNEPLTAIVEYALDKMDVDSYWLDDGERMESDPTLENMLLPPTGYIEVVKTDDSGARLPGAEFTLYDAAGAILKTAVSDTNGIARFSDITIHLSYTIRETKAPEGYEASKEVISFTLVDNQTRTFTVVNKKLVEKPGSISILKTDESGRPLAGAVFTLYDKDGKTIETVVTQADGTAAFANVPAGAYTVSETRAPLGYEILTGATAVTLKSEQTVSLTFINKKDLTATGTLQLLKVDKDYHPLSGAEFTLYDKDGNEIAKAISGSDGSTLFEGLAPGKYTVKETVAPNGYKLFSEPLTVQIGAASTALSYTLRNTLLNDDSGVEGWDDDNDGGTLPQTGGVPWTFYLLLAGLTSLLTGLVLMRPEKKRGKHLPKNR